jgi:hypothetical protein
MTVSDAKQNAEALSVNEDYAFGGWRQYFVVIWRGETTMEAVDRLKTDFNAFAKTRADGAGFLTVVERHAPLPSGSVRDELARFLSAASILKASAVVFEGSGFRAAAVRSVVTGLTLLAKQPFPHKVFATVTQGSHWLVPEMNRAMGDAIGADELIDAVAVLRGQLDQRAA